jgi:hypothetical protein
LDAAIAAAANLGDLFFIWLDKGLSFPLVFVNIDQRRVFFRFKESIFCYENKIRKVVHGFTLFSNIEIQVRPGRGGVAVCHHQADGAKSKSTVPAGC